MNYPSFSDAYGAARAAPAQAPQGAGGMDSSLAGQQENPWEALMNAQQGLKQQLDPWALEAQQQPNIPQAQGGKK